MPTLEINSLRVSKLCGDGESHRNQHPPSSSHLPHHLSISHSRSNRGRLYHQECEPIYKSARWAVEGSYAPLPTSFNVSLTSCRNNKPYVTGRWPNLRDAKGRTNASLFAYTEWKHMFSEASIPAGRIAFYFCSMEVRWSGRTNALPCALNT